MKLDVLVRTPSVVVDATGFPVVLVSISGAPTRDEFRQLLEGCSRLLDRPQRFIAIVDARLAGRLSFDNVLDASAWFEKEDGRLRRRCRGAAFASPFVDPQRANAAFLRVCPLRRRATFDDVTPALRWAVEILGPPSTTEAPEFS